MAKKAAKKKVKRKRRKNPNKGGIFERAIAVKLSSWMTDGERTDILWRSAGSGGRATMRRRSGKDTANSHSDLRADDPIGFAFLKCLTTECKHGYAGNSSSMFHFIESIHADKGLMMIEGWLLKLQKESTHAGSISHALICCRGGKTLIVFPNRFHRLLQSVGGYYDGYDNSDEAGPVGSCTFYTRVGVYRCMPLQTFFINVRPSQIQRIAAKYANAKTAQAEA